MSKAFTKDLDGENDLDPPEDTSLHDKNYMTPVGYAEMQAELRLLIRGERPKVVEVVRWAAGNGDRSENGDYIYGKKRLREIDRRVRYLTKRIESAIIVKPELQQSLQAVFFGATVTYMTQNAETITIQIVGVDEADLNKQKISWLSPVAKALFKAEVDDKVTFTTTQGLQTLTIMTIQYQLN
jgi:transcription elongation factor GreB